MIYQIYKKQVEAWKERFKDDFAGGDMHSWERAQPLLSSRHKDTIELIEGEIERKKKLREEVKERFDAGDTVRWINQGGNLTSNQADSIKYLGHYQAIDEDIAYLEETAQKIRNTYNL